MKLKENIALSESGFLFDPVSGESFSVNSTGKTILKMVVDGKNMTDIESYILSEFDIDQKTFVRYMDDFRHTLRRFNLLETDTNE